MKKNEIDIELLINIIFNTPDNYDINSIDFIGNNIRVNTSFDYTAVKKAAQAEYCKKMSDDYQEWVKRLDDYNQKVEQGVIIPDKRIGWERQLAACYDNKIALEVENELKLLNKPKKRGRPRKDSITSSDSA